MKKLLILVLTYFFFIVQSTAQYNKKEIIADYNKDGVLDTLRSRYDGGSAFGGTYVKIIDGKTKKVFKMNSWGASSQMMRFINVNNELLQKNNKYFYKELKKRLLPKKRRKPDISLQWILNGLKHHKELEDDPYFSLIVDPKTKWKKMKTFFPEAYYYYISKKELHKLYKNDSLFLEAHKEAKNILTYFTNSHYSFNEKMAANHNLPVLSTSSSKYKIYKTSHGILAKKGTKYKWLFISVSNLTGAPDNVYRWKSIGKIVLKDKYIIFKHEVPPDSSSSIYIINIETGICGELNFRPIYRKGSFSIKNNNIILYLDKFFKEKKTINIQNLIDAFEKQNIKKL